MILTSSPTYGLALTTLLTIAPRFSIDPGSTCNGRASAVRQVLRLFSVPMLPEPVRPRSRRRTGVRLIILKSIIKVIAFTDVSSSQPSIPTLKISP
jgi:hypothetical protein